MTVFDVKVYFDTLCPWCYIGHKAFSSAVSLYRKTYPGGSKDSFEYTFLPYYVNPGLPSPGLPWEEVVARKNGQERVNAIRTRLARVGRAHQIDFKFSNVGNTRDSHRLLQYGQKRSGSDSARTKALLEAIYWMHFEEEGTDVTSFDDLTRAAVAAGWEEGEVRDFLESGEGAQEVDDLVQEAKEAGLSGVPLYEINGLRVEGAEDVSAFLETIVQAREKADSEA